MSIYVASQGGSFLGKRYREDDILDTKEVEIPKERSIPTWFRLERLDPVVEVVDEKNIVQEVVVTVVETDEKEKEVTQPILLRTKEELVEMGSKAIGELYFASFGEKIKVGGKSNEDVAQLFLDRQEKVFEI